MVKVKRPSRGKYPFESMTVGGPAYQEVLEGKTPWAIYSAFKRCSKKMLAETGEVWKFTTRSEWVKGKKVVTVWRVQ